MKNCVRLPRLATFYERFVELQDTATFLKQTADAYSVGTLERLAVHPLRKVRRGAVLALGYLAGYESNAVLGRALRDDDRLVRTYAEDGIRNLWVRVGEDWHREKIGEVVHLNISQKYHEAIRRCTELLEEAPWFAEVWNQRAIAQYHLGRFLESINDCNRALDINPYRFGAAAGMGQGYLQLGHRQSALESFRRALRLNPNLESMRAGIAYLERLLKSQP